MKKTMCVVFIAAGITGCAALKFSQGQLPDTVRVAAGHDVVQETVGVGTIVYECRAKKDNAGFEWAFIGSEARLLDRNGQPVGRYYGPPATWESKDGSRVTGAQVAVSPASTGSIPLQLVKANPATGIGAMQGVTFIQRVATKGGVAPSVPCDAAATGKREVVRYQADYIFYKAK